MTSSAAKSSFEQSESLSSSYVQSFLERARQTLDLLRSADIEAVAQELVAVRERGGRVFFLGVGGSAANCSHAVNDFRKLANIECYAPTDNVAELSARTNDEGWNTVFSSWLRTSRLNANDLVFVLSVGGGDAERSISANIVAGLQYAQNVRARVTGIVSRDGGFTLSVADACVLVPTVEITLVTPLAESFQSLILHLLVSHPLLQCSQGKWESVESTTENGLVDSLNI